MSPEIITGWMIIYLTLDIAHEPKNQNWLDDHSSHFRQVAMSPEIRWQALALNGLPFPNFYLFFYST